MLYNNYGGDVENVQIRCKKGTGSFWLKKFNILLKDKRKVADILFSFHNSTS